MVLVGLIGFPVKHSISAAFQQAAFDHLGMKAQYEVWEVTAEELEDKLVELREPDHLGANVTIPHKETVIRLLDYVDDLARRIGAVNTIVNQGGHLVGFNTDAQGFLAALRQDGGFEPRGRSAVLLGAGGAARAAASILVEEGIGSLAIINRSQERAKALSQDTERRAKNKEHGRVTAYPWETQSLSKALDNCDLVVNCTPLGTWGSKWAELSPLEASSIPPGALVYDLVYNPPETPLLAEARKAGARTLKGLPMLVYQGAASFQLWTGRKPPVEIMAEAARRALGLEGGD